MDGFGFDVIPEHLNTAATGIDDAVGQIGDAIVREIGGGADYGHSGLHGALSQFLSSTHGHIEGCQQDAGNGSQALRMNAGTYTGTDGREAGVFGGR
jgi:Excreted virulence factor EspC, type VII ESX diderm